jgi:hypothetical protein
VCREIFRYELSSETYNHISEREFGERFNRPVPVAPRTRTTGLLDMAVRKQKEDPTRQRVLPAFPSNESLS